MAASPPAAPFNGDTPARSSRSSASALPGRATRNRVALLALLEGCAEFASAQELQDLSAATESPISLTTVYRTLHLLERAELVDIIRDDRGERLYRRRRGEEHQHYLICRSCSRSVPVDSTPVESWAADLGPAVGFADVEHVVELTGVCERCVQTGRAAAGRLIDSRYQ